MNPVFFSITSALLTSLLLLSCSSNGESKGEGRKAEKASNHSEKSKETLPFAGSLILKQKPNTLSEIDLEVMESSPLQFALNFSLQAPTPGYEAKVGKLEAKDKALRVRVDLEAPGSPSLTVLDQVQVRIPLGELRVGSWTLQVRVFQDNKLLSTLPFVLEAKK
jgi:hypothetical protein